jgi:hypothetical protein
LGLPVVRVVAAAAFLDLGFEKAGVILVVGAAQFLDLGERLQFLVRVVAQAPFIVIQDVGDAGTLFL